MNRSVATIRSANISTISPAMASSNRSMCRPIGPRSDSRTRPPGCSALPRKPAGRMPSSPMRISASEDVRPQLDRLERYLAGARRAHAAALAREPALSLRRARRSVRGPDDPPQRRAARRLRLELRPAGVRAADAGRGRPCRGLSEGHLRAAARRHAGGSVARRPRRLARRHGAAGGVPERRLQALGARHLHSSQRSRAYRRHRCRDGRDLRRRIAACSVRTFRSRSYGPAIASWSRPISTPSHRTPRHRDAILHDTAMRVYRIAP